MNPKIQALFTTPKQLPFLEMTVLPDNRMQLQCNEHLPHLQPGIPVLPFSAWFNLVDISHILNWNDYKIRAANIIANRVASETRRNVANILFVPNSELEMYYLNSYVMEAWCKKIVIDPSMRDNELRVTFWKIVNGMAVDGGVQFNPLGNPAGFSRLPSWSKYFQRCFT